MKKVLLTVIVIKCLSGLVAAQPAAAGPADFIKKGYHIDLRIQVIKMPALKAFVQRLKNNGVNTLIMEWEAAYPFEKYPVIANRYAYSKSEIRSFMHFCDSLGLDVMPLQQSFGHVEYILRHYRFAGIREDQRDFSQVCPSEEVAGKALFTDLFTELAQTHASRYFHIGGDETYLLGHCEKCQKKAAQEGISKLYIDHIKMLCDIVIKLGKRPVLWADIALKHPEAIQLLPKETVFIDWNYGWDLNSFGNLDNLIKSGYEIWGAPAIRSGGDNYYLTQWQVHFNNLRNFVPTARKIGYTGIILTSWATNGIFNPIFNSGWDIIDLYPRGHRYPFTGSDMLLSAFFESIATPEPLNIRTYIHRYAARTFDFTQGQADLFYNALSTCAYEIRQNKVIAPNPPTVRQMLDSTRLAAVTLRRLQPVKGREPFAHLLLMTDIRVQYLESYVLENEMNETTYNSAQYEVLASRLKAVLDKSADLDRRFIALNKNTFYLAELQSENSIRSQHIRVLYDKASKNKHSTEQAHAAR